MLLAILDFLIWLQPAATPAAGASGGGGGSSPMSCGMNAAMMLGILAITYFFLLRPDAQKRRETEDMLKNLKVGMKVRTTGGILGEIVRVTDRDVTLAIAEKVRINVLRENIKGPEVLETPKDAKEPGTASATVSSSATASNDDKK